MINLYTGVAGSGKGYHIALRVFESLRRSKINIISTCPVDIDTLSLSWLGWLKRRLHDRFGVGFRHYNKVRLKGKFYFWSYDQVTPANLLLFAKQNHDPKARIDVPQTLLIIDEGGVVFNCRDFSSKGRAEWLKFVAMHRHYGYDILIACQFDRQIDRQIRNNVDLEFRHRNLSVIPIFGLVKLLFRRQVFLSFGYWYSTANAKKMSTDIFFFKPRIGAIYNTLSDVYEDLAALGDKLPAGCMVGGGGQGAPPPTVRPGGLAALLAVIAGGVKRLRQLVHNFNRSKLSGVSVDCKPVDLSQLFGRDIDVTQPIPAPQPVVPGADDDTCDLNSCDADHGADS